MAAVIEKDLHNILPTPFPNKTYNFNRYKLNLVITITIQ
jgi:hypothetical protein